MSAPHPRMDRRAFLGRTTVAGAAIVAGAALVPVSRYLPLAGAQSLAADTAAAYLESVELAVADVYDAVQDVLSPDAQTRAERYRDHHLEHAEGLAALAGEAATGRPNQALLDALAPRIEEATGGAAAFTLLQGLENQLVVTDVHLLSLVQDGAVAGAIAAVLPVESAHATELGIVLDQGYDSWFPFGAFESGDITLGLDPAAFPVA